VKTSLALQAAAAVILATISTHILVALDYRSPINLLLMFIIILFIAWKFNKGFAVRLSMAATLFFLFFITMAANIWLFGYAD
jgi:hypothetical protein